MKSLAALKREAVNYRWSLVETNSRFYANGIPDFYLNRKVAKVQSDRIAFETIKNNEVLLSWATLPKAKQVSIVQDDSTDDAYFVTLTDDAGTFLKYHLLNTANT